MCLMMWRGRKEKPRKRTLGEMKPKRPLSLSMTSLPLSLILTRNSSGIPLALLSRNSHAVPSRKHASEGNLKSYQDDSSRLHQLTFSLGYQFMLVGVVVVITS